MNRILNKISIALFTLLISIGMSLALEEEYKNSLEKVELIKTGDSTYSVNLYTQKEYKEPVKVIKKSDLNYYILLPETKNSASQTASNSNEIRSLTTNSYSYAGANVKNGYTKININTTKPIDFRVSAKTNNPKTASQNTITMNTKQSDTEEASKSNQKKNSDFQKNNKAQQPKLLTKLAAKQEIKKEENHKKIPPITSAPNKNEMPKAMAAAKIQPQETQNPINPDEMIDMINQEIEKNKTNQENSEDTILEEETSQEYDDISLPPVNDFENEKNNSISALSIIRNKLANFGISLKGLIVMFLAAFSCIFAIVYVIAKRRATAKSKPKANLIEDDYENYRQPQKKGQYFVFDKNIKQTGFYDPVLNAKRKNYELSSYDPELRINYAKRHAQTNKYISGQNKAKKVKPQNEYDIIRKALKEENKINTAPYNYKPVLKTVKMQKAPVQTQIKKQPAIKVQKPQPKKLETVSPIQKTKEIPVPKKDEPFVLSKVEIAPERGFMCIKYNDNVSLVGYMFDDVFALYNFKSSELNDYNIKFRQTDKDDNGTYYIVKIANTKMLIKVTKSTMNKEINM